MALCYIVRQKRSDFSPNPKVFDKVFFSLDSYSWGPNISFSGGWHIVTLEQFEKSKMASKMAARPQMEL